MMSNLAEKLIEPAVDRAEEELDVIIEVRSMKHDCHVAYRLSKFEMDNNHIMEIIRSMKYRMLDFIQEKLNAASEGKGCEVEERLLN